MYVHVPNSNFTFTRFDKHNLITLQLSFDLILKYFLEIQLQNVPQIIYSDLTALTAVKAKRCKTF